MKSSVLTLAVLLFATAPVVAQQTAPMTIVADCSSSRSIKQFIYESMQEVPFSGGWGIFQTSSGDFVEGIWKIYSSPDWATFTIAVEFPNDAVMCLVGMGDNLEPFQDRSTR